MTCRHQDRHDPASPIVTTGAHVDPLPADHDADCSGCRPCDREHCTRCSTHLDDEIQTCTECRAQARRDLRAVIDLAAMLPDHARNAAHDGRLIAAEWRKVGPGGDATAMMSRGSEGLSDPDALDDEPSPPSFVLGWWEEQWREQLGLDSQRPVWQRRPEHTVASAFRFLDQHLTWAAANQPGFAVFARDLHSLRRHLEELLRAGDEPLHGVACFDCGATLERDYRPPKPCTCGPRPRLEPHTHLQPHNRTDVCCLGCANYLRWQLALEAWEATHRDHDQGGLADTDPHAGWHCPRCRRHYSAGEYQLAIKARHDEVARYRRLDDAARITGAKPGTIKVWATRNRVRRRRDGSGRVTYNVPDIRARLAATTDAEPGREIGCNL